jgi:hypothetical protein
MTGWPGGAGEPSLKDFILLVAMDSLYLISLNCNQDVHEKVPLPWQNGRSGLVLCDLVSGSPGRQDTLVQHAKRFKTPAGLSSALKNTTRCRTAVQTEGVH